MAVVAVTLALVAPAAGSGPRLSTMVAEQQVAVWRCQDQLGVERTRAAVSPWALPKSRAYRAWVLNKWTARHKACAAALRERARQWNWRSWLPANWSAVARCETHYNWWHANAVYVSAFGISRREYDADAAVYGAPPWNDARPPTPWHQYQAALGHYKRFGDGWSCPGP